MVRVASIQVDGLDLRFYSSDHLPPHFHARSPGAWEIRIYIMETTASALSYRIKWSKTRGKAPRKYIRLLRDLTVRHRLDLLAEWEANVVVRDRGS